MANPYPTKEAVAKGFRMNNALGAEFVIAGDMNPGVDMVTKVNVNSPAAELKKTNSINHGPDGQNFLFADGHVEFDNNAFCGVKRDNVYSYGPSGDDAKDKGGDGIVGAPVGPNDSVLLPTAKDLGVVDANGALTDAGKKSRAAAIEAMRPVSPQEQEKTRQRVFGTYTRTDGRNATMKITEGKIELTGDKAATFNFKFAGLDRTKAMLTLISPSDATQAGKAVIEFTDRGVTITLSPELSGTWKKQ
jgi:prepilin-type processing-associated H-X9-DG protein